jgi:hypothetical protein
MIEYGVHNKTAYCFRLFFEIFFQKNSKNKKENLFEDYPHFLRLIIRIKSVRVEPRG